MKKLLLFVFYMFFSFQYTFADELLVLGTTTSSEIIAELESNSNIDTIRFSEDTSLVGQFKFNNNIKIIVENGKIVNFIPETSNYYKTTALFGNKNIDIENNGVINFSHYNRGIDAIKGKITLKNGEYNIKDNTGYGIYTLNSLFEDVVINMNSNSKAAEAALYLGNQYSSNVKIINSTLNLTNNSDIDTSSSFQSQAGIIEFKNSIVNSSSKSHYNFNVYNNDKIKGNEQNIIFDSSELNIDTPTDSNPHKSFLTFTFPVSAVGINSSNTNFSFNNNSILTHNINNFTGKTDGIELDGANFEINNSTVDFKTVGFDNNTAQGRSSLVDNTFIVNGESKVTIGKFNKENYISKLPKIEINGGSFILPSNLSNELPKTSIENKFGEVLTHFEISKSNLPSSITSNNGLDISGPDYSNPSNDSYFYGLSINNLHSDIANIWTPKVEVNFYSNKSDAETKVNPINIDAIEIPRSSNIKIVGQSLPTVNDPDFPSSVWKYLNGNTYNVSDSLDKNLYLYVSYLPILETISLKEIQEGENYNILDLIIGARDKIDGDIKTSVIIENDGGFNKDLPGEYTVTFSVTDTDGNKVTSTSIIKVINNVSSSGGGSSPCIKCFDVHDDKKVVIPSNEYEEDIIDTKEDNLDKEDKQEVNIIDKEKEKLKDFMDSFEPVGPMEPTRGEGEFNKYPTELPKTGVQEEIYRKGGLAGIIHKTLLDVVLPNKEVFRLAGSENRDLSYWLQVLPEQDRNKDKYIVIPSKGLVMPINIVPEEESAYDSFINGNNENFVEYLDDGSVELPGTSTRGYGEVGNKVIGGHSSYWYNKSRYRTHFQQIIGLSGDKQIWIYEKDKNTGEFNRFIYKVFASYNTSKNDISILKPTNNKQLTLLTCTPIGGTHGRWIVKAEFIGN